MANPRKFSEKIALHTHRQAEETAAFEKIMKEVSDVKVASPHHLERRAQPSKNTLRIGQALGNFRGGSLPDVSARPSSATAPAKMAAVTSSPPETSKPNEEPPQSRMSSSGPRQSRTRSPGGPIRSTRERKPSPYASGPYLSPPSDTGWRRTNSDSALHQSAMQGMGMERTDPNQRVSWGMLPIMNGPERGTDGRLRSGSYNAPRVPGIHIYPSAHDPGMIQIPIGNNTGSLPDLTNMEFTSPINAIDGDLDNSSPYSSSPLNTSPSTLSPTSMMAGGVRPHNRFNFTPPVSQPSLSNHLSVPSSSSRYSRVQQRSLSQSDKNIALDNTDFSQLGAITGMYQQHQQQQQQQPQQQQQQQQQQQPGSPASPVQLPQMDGYRSPRPSPQPSPTLGGRHSAPCSPGEPSPLQNDYHIHNQNMQFQQHFEQLTMDWAQLVASLMESGCTWTAQLETSPLESDTPLGQMSYGDQSVTSPQMAQSHPQNIPDGPSDAGYYSTSPSQQLGFPSPSPGLQNTSPNTPTSVPEIILTDFSAGQDISRQLETEFLTDEQLKEGLGSLDFSELHMLNMSEIVEDYRS